jgi:hypothetical protein
MLLKIRAGDRDRSTSGTQIYPNLPNQISTTGLSTQRNIRALSVTYEGTINQLEQHEIELARQRSFNKNA